MTQTDELILPDDYLVAERARDYWHEFAAGKLRRRAKSSVGHSLIRQNLMVALHTHHVLATEEEREVVVHHRSAGKWTRCVLVGQSTLSIPELNFSISLDALYEGTNL